MITSARATTGIIRQIQLMIADAITYGARLTVEGTVSTALFYAVPHDELNTGDDVGIWNIEAIVTAKKSVRDLAGDRRCAIRGIRAVVILGARVQCSRRIPQVMGRTAGSRCRCPIGAARKNGARVRILLELGRVEVYREHVRRGDRDRRNTDSLWVVEERERCAILRTVTIDEDRIRDDPTIRVSQGTVRGLLPLLKSAEQGVFEVLRNDFGRGSKLGAGKVDARFAHRPRARSRNGRAPHATPAPHRPLRGEKS